MISTAERGATKVPHTRHALAPRVRRSSRRTPSCSIVIRCYNEERHIGRLLSGIARQTLANVETIVVDSGSTDATLSIAGRYPVRIVSLDPRAFSFGRALNLGFSAATAEVVVAASAHVYPLYHDWLSLLIEPLTDARVSLCYGKQRGDHRTRFSERQLFAQWFPDRSTFDQDSPFCNNANVAVRRSAWQRHPYDESLTGLEDLAWATAARARGERIAYRAEAEVAHVHEENARAVFNRYRREAIALSRIAPDERLTFLELCRLLPTHVAQDWVAAARQGTLRSSFWDIPLFRSAQFFGAYRGGCDAPAAVQRLKHRFYYPGGEPARPALEPRSPRWIRYGEPSSTEAF